MNAPAALEERLFDRRILVVDDYELTRRMIVDALLQTGYTSVEEATDGLEALDLFKAGNHDLIITDVMMPHMDGMELLDRLQEIRADSSIILVTGQPEVDAGVAAMKRGAVDYVRKPFNIQDLLYKVEVCLRERYLLPEEDHENALATTRLTEKKKELSVHSHIYDSFENIEGENQQVFEKMAELALRVVDGVEATIWIFDAEADQFHPQVVRFAEGQAHEPGGNVINAIPFLYQVVDKRGALVVQSPNGEGGDASLLCAPLVIRGAVFGVLTVRRKKYTGIFTSKDVHYIVSLTKRASLNLENKLLYESLFANVLDTFQSLVACVQMRDNYTQEHCRRVTKVSIRTADVLGLDTQDRECLKVAGVLHDVGKIAIPDAVLLKPGRLTDEEYEVIKRHSALGESVLRPIALFDREREIILHHHERWDGKGYPSGLAGTDIPFLSRIIAVVDTFDAMTNNRPYRKALDVGTALDEIRRNRGTQFDPDVADAFLSLY
ncbi:MAG TPA: HD domain-containing response regulator [Syntrophales bacterium]|nr:HD domain-containing response regulator [Syntrophales bacterium]